jgi:hypothetical protein
MDIATLATIEEIQTIVKYPGEGLNLFYILWNRRAFDLEP